MNKEYEIIEKPRISVEVNFWRYHSTKEESQTYVALDENGVKVSGEWGDGVDKRVLEKDLADAIKKVIEKHCK